MFEGTIALPCISTPSGTVPLLVRVNKGVTQPPLGNPRVEALEDPPLQLAKVSLLALSVTDLNCAETATVADNDVAWIVGTRFADSLREKVEVVTGRVMVVPGEGSAARPAKAWTDPGEGRMQLARMFDR